MKIVVCGPVKSGKSCLVNCLSQDDYISIQTEKDNCDYDKNYIPTFGCRIVEVENFSSMSKEASMEFWDTAGNCASEAANYLPALLDDAYAVIFVYNPLNPLHCSEIELWYELVVDNRGVKHNDDSCLVLMHYDTLDVIISTTDKTPSCFRECQVQKTNFATEANEARHIVSRFVQHIPSNA